MGKKEEKKGNPRKIKFDAIPELRKLKINFRVNRSK